MEKNTLDILSDAISETGSWQWWHIDGDMCQVEFSDVLLYDETKTEKAPHTSVIAIRFKGNAFGITLKTIPRRSGTTDFTMMKLELFR